MTLLLVDKSALNPGFRSLRCLSMRQLVNPFTFGRPCLKLALFGCTNRPFYRIVVFPDKRLGRWYEGNILEQVGTYDPLPNYNNEKLVSLNIGRIKYWIGEKNVQISVPVAQLLGLAGLFPIHPKTFIDAREKREMKAATETKQDDNCQEATNSA